MPWAWGASRAQTTLTNERFAVLRPAPADSDESASAFGSLRDLPAVFGQVERYLLCIATPTSGSQLVLLRCAAASGIAESE
ncbi:MAG: hypothetical protein EBU85_02145 [Actinobacteria bacterium]|nr:hypothetical protein [Actinomycetota bacterium]